MGFQIFLSAKTTTRDGKLSRDNELASEVFDYLQLQGYSVFLSTLTLEAKGEDAYMEAIDSALDEASVLVVVGTCLEHLESKWVRYEWTSFFNDILSGHKPNGHLFTYLENLKSPELPRMLRQRQVFLHDSDSLMTLGNFIRNAIGSGSADGRHREVQSSLPSTSKATTRVSVRVVSTNTDFSPQVQQAMDVANREQSFFNFYSSDDDLSSSIRLVTMRNIFAPDYFDRLTQIRVGISPETNFLIAVTDSPVAGKHLTNLFGSHRAEEGVALITTNLVPDIVIPSNRMVAYFVYYLARYTLSFVFPGLKNHDDTRGCVFDRKIVKRDLVQSMKGHALCDECRAAVLGDPNGLQCARKIDALDRLVMLSGDLLREK